MRAVGHKQPWFCLGQAYGPGGFKMAPSDLKVCLPACPRPQGPATWEAQMHLGINLGYLCWETGLHIGKFQQPKMAFLKGPGPGHTQLQKGFLHSESHSGAEEVEAVKHLPGTMSSTLQSTQLLVSLPSSCSHSICFS